MDRRTTGVGRQIERAARTVGLLAAAVGLAACAATPVASVPASTAPTVSATPLASGSLSASPSASAPLSRETLITCGSTGSLAFPASGLTAPTGAERGSGPEFDALRAALATYGPNFPHSKNLTWRLAGRTASTVTFLAWSDAGADSGWLVITVGIGEAAGMPSGMGSCNPRVILSRDLGPADWTLDPAFPTPDPDATELHVLVWELACDGGGLVTGRIADPAVVYGPTLVAITLNVRPLGLPATCPLGPGTPFTVHLSEPLGGRTILDGGRVPPAPPTGP